MTMTNKQFARMITSALDAYQKGEDRLNEAVHWAICHAVIYRAPDMLVNVHAALIANANTLLAKRFREYVRDTSAWVWNDKASTFSLRKKLDDNEDFFEAWNERLGQNWRVLAEKVNEEKKEKPVTREQGAKRAIDRATVHTAADREAAALLMLKDMSADEIYQTLVNGKKIDALLAYIAEQQKAAA